MIPTRFAIPAGALVLGLVIGLGAGWKLYRPKAAPVETAAPAVRQADQSLVLERKPEAKPQPKHELPKGAKLERQVQAIVQPYPLTGVPSIPGSGDLVPKPVTFDLSLVKLQDGTSRVIASSPNGVVTGGLDIPAGPPAPVLKMPKWQAGALWNPGDHTYGAFVTHATGPFVLGAQLYQERMPVQVGGGTSLKGMIALGVRW